MESSISGWAGHLRDFLFITDREYLFVAKDLTGGAKVWHFVWDGGSWQQTAAISTMGETVFSAGEQDEPENLAETASQVDMEIAKKGWQNLPVIYVVPEAELIRYALQLPPDLSAEEEREAAYWELDDKLLAKGLSAEDFACLCQPDTNMDGQCLISGVRKGYLQAVQTAFAQAELKLYDMIPADGEGLQGALAYLKNPRREGAGFCGRTGAEFACGRLLFVWLALMLLICVCVAGMDVYQYQQAKSLATERQTELALMEQERQQMAALTARRAAVEKREGLWQQLGRQGIAAYGLLVHVGISSKEGVCLTRISAGDEGGTILLEGQAVNYDCLMDFMGQLEQDRDYFSAVALDNSALASGQSGEADRIQFTLRINGESDEYGKTHGKAQHSR